MDPLERFEGIAHAARRAPPPETDVRDRVLARIRAEAPTEDGALWWAAALAAAAALVVAVLASQSLWGAADPLNVIFQNGPGIWP